MKLSAAPTSRNTADNSPTTSASAWSARRSGTAIGTETTWMPSVSPSFQPKPFDGP